jgi:hypothetical protein
MQTRRERIGLQAGLTVQRDDRAWWQRPILPDHHVFLVDDARRVFRHDDHAEEAHERPVEQDREEEDEGEGDHRPYRPELRVSHGSSPVASPDEAPSAAILLLRKRP